MPLPAVRPWRAAGFCVDWFAGRFVGLSVCRFAGYWFAGWLVVGLLVCWFAGLLVCWFVGLLVCWFVGLLVCWFVGLLVCCLVDWFAGVGWLCRLWLVACFSFQFGRICNPGACFSRFVICHALRCRVLAICCQPRRSSASGSRNHRATLYCRQAAFLCNRSTEIRFGGSAPLHRCPSLRSGHRPLTAADG